MNLSRIADPQRTVLLRAGAFLQHLDECVVLQKKGISRQSEAGLQIPEVLEEPLIGSGFLPVFCQEREQVIDAGFGARWSIERAPTGFGYWHDQKFSNRLV